MDAAAAADEPFSIRGYAARMRAADAAKCWPFDGRAALPPMQVRRFRWWGDEVRRAAPEEEEEGVEGRMAAKRRKRSIVELFAAVPQMEAAAGGGGGEEGLGRRRRRRKKNKLMLETKSKKVFKKRKRERVQIEITVDKKEKSNKQKITSLSISQLFRDVVQKRKFRKSLSHKKKCPEVAVLLENENVKVNPKSVLDNEKDIVNNCPVQSILKKQLKTSSTGKGRLLSNTDVGSPLKPSHKPKKHVTFSGKDDILGRIASVAEDNTEESQLVQMSQRLSQGGKSDKGDNPYGTEEPQLVCEREINATSVIVEDNISSISEKVELTDIRSTVPLTEPKDPSNDFLHKERTVLDDSVDLNHCIEMSNSGNCLNSVSSAFLCSQVHPQNFDAVSSHQTEGSTLDVGCHAEESSHMAPKGSSLPFSLATEASSEALIRNTVSQPSNSCLVTNLEVNDRNRCYRTALLGAKQNANCHLPEVHPRILRSGKDVMSSISSSTGSNKSTDAQTADCVSACRNMCFNEDYVGLPLNSQGEFVKVNPGGTLNPDEIFKRRCMGEGASGCLPVPDFVRPETSMDYTDIRINHHAAPFYTKENFGFHPEPYFTPTMPAMYGLGFMQLPGFERMEIQNYGIPRDKHPSVYHNECSMKSFCSGCMGQNCQPQNLFQMKSFLPSHSYEQTIQPAAETTMRLMGKTVTLGTTSKQCRGLDNEKPCAHKQIRAEDHYSQRICSKAFPQLPHGGLVAPRTFGTSNRGGTQPLEIPSHISSIPAVELRFGLGNDSFRMSGHHQQPQAVPNKPFGEPVTRYNEVEFGHQRPFVATQTQNACEHMLLSSTHCKHTQSVASTSNPQDSHRNFVEIRPAPAQSTRLPQWLSNVTQRTPISSLLSGYAAHSPPGLVPELKFTSFPPPLPSSVIPYHVYNSANAQPGGSTPIIYPSIPSAYPTNKLNNPVNSICKDTNKKGNATKSNFEGLECMNRSCRRPAEKDDGFLSPPKQPRLAIEKDLNVLAVPEKRQELHGSGPDTGTREMPVCLNKALEVDLQPINNDANATGSGSSSRTKSGGPMKLKPGAKHLLKPSSHLDQENSRPVHSSTPFPVGNDVCTVTKSKKRTAEIYRF